MDSTDEVVKTGSEMLDDYLANLEKLAEETAKVRPLSIENTKGCLS